MSSEVRFGNVSSIDYEAGKCEVTYPDRDDTVTEMVPFLSNGEYQTPEVGDIVLVDRKSTRLNSSHTDSSRMPSSA